MVGEANMRVGVRGGTLVGLLLVTISAVIVMITIGTGRLKLLGDVQPPPSDTLVASKAVVSILDVTAERVELVESYHGIIQPLEQHTLAFEVPGLLKRLGTNDEGQPLDVGDRVRAGQELAALDQKRLQSQLKEARARLELAQYDLQQYDQIRATNPRALSEQQYQQAVTTSVEAEAMHEIAVRNLEDATLVSPVDAVISARHVNVGASINMHQPVFELLEVDDVLLVAGIPESRVREIEVGQPAHAHLLAKDPFGRPRPPVQGIVHQVAEAADERGLFEVEVRLPNPAGDLRPGMVARADIVIDTVEAFRLPVEAAVVRDGDSLLYYVDEQAKARRFELGPTREQEGDLIVLDLPPEQRRVVIDGQHRLVDGRDVEIYDAATAVADSPGANAAATTATTARDTVIAE